MGNQNFTNWNSTCEQGCEEEVISVGCACETNTDCSSAEPADGRRGRKHGHHENCEESDGAHIYFDACDSYREMAVSASCQQEKNPGRVLDVTPTLMDVCPGRRSALGLTLTEVDSSGTEHARGFQAIQVPAHNGRCNQDITLDPVRFILPEEMGMQGRRHFILRTQHHYLDAGNIWNNSWGR